MNIFKTWGTTPPTIFLTFILMFMLAGCKFGNLQIYEKSNVYLSGANCLGWGAFRYGFIRVGTSENPFYKSTSQFVIKFPNGEVLKSTDFTADNIKKIWAIETLVDKDNKWYKLSYNQCIIYFNFEDSKLMRFECYCFDFADPEEVNFQIGAIDGIKFYKIPLRRWQIEEIFGKADNIQITWQY
jgi:hypothetical protein